jgi:hypothetical protein
MNILERIATISDNGQVFATLFAKATVIWDLFPAISAKHLTTPFRGKQWPHRKLTFPYVPLFDEAKALEQAAPGPLVALCPLSPTRIVRQLPFSLT